MRSFEEARQRLETVPVARPAIFTLVGCRPGERCVIERTEEGHVTRQDPASAANDWLVGTRAVGGADRRRPHLTCTYAEAGEHSRAAARRWPNGAAVFPRDAFAWVAPPVLNKFTRLAAEMCPATGTLRVAGYECLGEAEAAQPVTQPCEVETKVAAR